MGKKQRSFGETSLAAALPEEQRRPRRSSDSGGLRAAYCNINTDVTLPSGSDSRTHIEFRALRNGEDVMENLRYPDGASGGAINASRGTVERINDETRIFQRLKALIRRHGSCQNSDIRAECAYGRANALKAEASLTFEGVHYEHDGGGWDEMDMDVVVVNGEHLLILQTHKEGH